MLLIIFLGLIAITSVSGDCDVGTRGLNYVDFTKVGISVLGGFLKQAVFKLCFGFYFICVFIDHLTIDQTAYIHVIE